MDLHVAEKMMQSIMEQNYFKVMALLRGGLGIPADILGTPGAGLRGYVNFLRVVDFSFYGSHVSARRGSFAFVMEPSNDSACYKPYLPGIMISTIHLEQDAAAAQLSENALLEILILHEIAHVAMMSKFAEDRNGICAEWIDSKKNRYIHEAVALRACESIFLDIYHVATKEDVAKYLHYVKNLDDKMPGEKHYLPYFLKFQAVPENKFWDTLCESSDFDWDKLKSQGSD